MALTLLPHRAEAKWLLLDPSENSNLQECLETDPGYQSSPTEGTQLAWEGACNPAGSTQVLEGALLLLSDLQRAPGTGTQRSPCQTPSRKLHLFLSGIEGKFSRSIIKLRAAFISRHCCASELAGSCVWVTPSVLPWECQQLQKQQSETSH